MNIYETIRLENEHNRLNDPATWDAMYRTCHIPKRMKTACLLKHGIRPDEAEFFIIRDKKRRICHLVCIACKATYVNRGLGWAWYSARHDVKKIYGKWLIPA